MYCIKWIPTSDFRVDGERIDHMERDAEKVDYDNDFEEEKFSEQHTETVEEIMSNRYWLAEMESFDFRGVDGSMCVGNSYTVCGGVPLNDDAIKDEGLYGEMILETESFKRKNYEAS